MASNHGGGNAGEQFKLAGTAQRAIERHKETVQKVEGEQFKLSETAQRAIERHKETVQEVEAKSIARKINVPTNDNTVKLRLRRLKQPICKFGENAPERRERLRHLLAKMLAAGTDIDDNSVSSSETAPERRERLRHLLAKMLAAGTDIDDNSVSSSDAAAAAAMAAAGEVTEQTKVFYTEGDVALKGVRLKLLNSSMKRAEQRVTGQKRRRARPDHVAKVKQNALFRSLRHFSSQRSEIGDDRQLTSCDVSLFMPLGGSSSSSSSSSSPSESGEKTLPKANDSFIVTGSNAGSCKLWSVDGRCLQAYRESGEKTLPKANDSLIVTGSNAESCKMWSVDGRCLQASRGHGNSRVADVSFVSKAPASDASLLFASSGCEGKGLVKLWSRKSFECLADLKGHTARTAQVAFHPHEDLLVSTSFDNTWRLWDVETQKSLMAQEGHQDSVYACAFHPDGSLLISGDLKGIALVWDLRSGQEIMHLPGHIGHILSCDFSPNGYLAATGGGDNTVKMWDLRKREIQYQILAHNKSVTSVKFEPNEGRFLATGSQDRTVKLWSSRDFKQLATLSGHEQHVTRCVVSADGSFLVSTSHDRTWKLWAKDDFDLNKPDSSPASADMVDG